MTTRHTVPRDPLPEKVKPGSLAAQWDRWQNRPAWHKPDADLIAGIEEAYRKKRAKVETAREAATVATETAE